MLGGIPVGRNRTGTRTSLASTRKAIAKRALPQGRHWKNRVDRYEEKSRGMSGFAGLWLTDRFNEIKDRLDEIQGKEDIIMGLVEDIQVSQAATKSALDSIAADEAALQQQIADLQAQIAAGSPATVEQLQAILDKSKSIQSQAEGIDTSVPGVSGP